MTVLQRPADATAAELLRTSPFGAAPIEVRGATGYSTGFTLQWFEPSTGMLVTIVGELAGLDTAELLRVAEGLRPAEPGEVEQLIRAGEPREVVVAEGDHDGPWRLMATMEHGTERLRLEHDGAVNAELEVDGAGRGLDMGFGAPGSALADAHYGVASPDAVEIVVETPDGARIPLETYDVVGLDGWQWKAFLGFLPDGVDEGYAFVAYDADGEVVGSIRLDPAVGG